MKNFKKSIMCKCIAIFGILIITLCILIVLPPFLRFSNRHNSDQIVPFDKVIGKWVQIDNSNILTEKDGGASIFSTYAIFKENGEYYLRYKCGDNTDYLEMAGKWHYDSSRYYFLGFAPLGYRNWIRLDFGHKSVPQFYLKTDNLGDVYLYRYSISCISNKEFVKISKVSE